MARQMSREIRARIVQRREVGSVRLSVDRSEARTTGRPATAHDHLTDEDIKEQSRHSSQHLRYVGVREKTRVVSADAREKKERDIEESHHRQRRQRFDL